jgi:hypothetical protein
LLALAEKEFDVFITGDRNLSFQQAVTKFDIAIIVLHAPLRATPSHATLDGESARRTPRAQTRLSSELVS